MNIRDRHLILCGKVCLLLDERENLINKVTVLKQQFQKIQDYEIILNEAANLLKEVAEICERNSKAVIEKIIDHGLRVIFNENENFSIRTETKARSMYAYMSLGQSSNIIDSRGGGYVDVISVITVLVLILRQRNMQRFLVLDESFAEVGREHLGKVGHFLQFLSNKLGITILIVTHANELHEFADILYELDVKNGKTIIKHRNINNPEYEDKEITNGD